MDGPKTAVASWKTQYYLDVQSAHGTPSGEGWKDAGLSVYAVLDAGVVAGGTGTQYVFTSWGGDATGTDYIQSDSIIMDSPKTAVANWRTQYMLTVTSDYGTSSGEGWKDAGTTAVAHLDTISVSGGVGIRYVFTSWSGDATGTDYAASDNILMDSPKTATALWQTQYMLTVTTDHGTPSGEGWQNGGTSVQVGLDTDTVAGTAGTRYVFTYWGGDASGTNYASSDSILMDSPKTAVANWKTQYLLTVASDHGTFSGDGWQDAGTFVHVSLDTDLVSGGIGTRYIFTSWGGDASGTDHSQSDDIVMDGPKTVTAMWQTQYRLSCTTYPSGLSPAPIRTPSGDWFDTSTNVTVEAQDVDGYTFQNWTIDGFDEAIIEKSINITMDAPHSVVAYYEETATTLTDTTTTGNQTSPPPSDGTMVIILAGGLSMAAAIIVVTILMKKKRFLAA